MKRKTLDVCSEESEIFECRFDRLLLSEHDEAERVKLIAEITAWMKECGEQGRYIASASAERRALRSLLERWNLHLRDLGYYVEGMDTLAEFDPSAGIILTGNCPYPGLEPYTRSRRGSFFGREALVSSCIDHLEQPGNRIILIVGASGSGKSSLVLAGVLPRLVEIYAGAWLFGPRMTPGSHPLVELAAGVAQAISRPEHAREIESALAAKPEEAWGQLAALCQDKPLLLFIDQFEELLTLCRDSAVQGGFARVLYALSAPTMPSSGFRCRVLLTLRTDHLARFESNDVLKHLYMRLVGEDNQRYLTAIGFEDIKRAIKGPADEIGLRFIPAGLTDQLASQTAGLSNGLPLLQFALRRLWDTRPKNESGEPLDLITAEMVNALPDVERALGTVADGIFRTFSASQQRVCERLLLELLVLDESFEEPLRRRRNEAELRQVIEAQFATPGDVAKVIDEFVAAGLLRRFGERRNSQLEVAHEALLRHWDHIYRLLTGAEVKERLHLVKQIGREAGDWMGHGKSHDYLSLRGERLARAVAYGGEGWLAEAEAAAYVDACRTQEDVERRKDKLAEEEKKRADLAQRAYDAAQLRALRYRRNLFAFISATLVVFVVSLGWFLVNTNEAKKLANEASSARQLAMAAEAQRDLDPQRSLLLAIEAAQHGQTAEGGLLPEVESAVRSAIRASRVMGLFKSHKALISAAAYTPDGSMLAMGDSLGGVRFWDVVTGLQRKALFGHVDSVNTIAFSPDGRKMATGSDDGKVVIWDAETGARLHVVSGHVGQVTGLAFSRPDGRLLATAGDDASLRIWNVSSGTPARGALYGHIGGVEAVSFGRDDRQLVTAGQDRRIVVWDGQKGSALYSITVSPHLFDIDVSGDGSLIAVSTGPNVEIWDTATRNHLWTLEGHTNSVLSVRFSRDPEVIATAGYDNTIRVWRLPHDARGQAKEVARISTQYTGGAALIEALAFDPAGSTVAASLSHQAVGSGEGTAQHRSTVTIWNVAESGELLTVRGLGGAAEAVAFSPDGRTIAAASGSNATVLKWDLSGGRQDHEFQDNQHPAAAIAYSAAGAFAVASGNDVLVALPGETERKRLVGHTATVNDLAFSPVGSRLVSGSDDGKAIVWDLASGTRLRVLDGHRDAVDAVAYSSDGKTIATGSKDATIILWNADTLKPKHPPMGGHFLSILDLAFTADDQQLVSGSKDRAVRIWDVATGKQQDVLWDHTDAVNAVAIHGTQLATGANDGIRLWNLRPLTPLPVFPARSLGAESLTFSRDGRYLAAGASDGTVRVYVMQTKELLEVANSQLHRGWTLAECQWFLRRDSCPQTSFSMIDEANLSFAKWDFEAGEHLLRRAKGRLDADDKAINTEVNAHLGTALLWAANSILEDPGAWADVAKGKDPRELAFGLLVGAKEKLEDRSFDPKSHWYSLNSYQHVKRARSLARDGKRKESIAAFRQARDLGWETSSPPEDAVSQLFAVRLFSKAWESPPSSPEEAGKLIDEAESALKQFPDFGPGHRVLANLYREQSEYQSAERHYREAAAKELSAEPLALLADLSYQEYERKKETEYATKAASYSKEALERDPGLDLAWFYLGLTEYALGHEEEAAQAFDQVSPNSELSVQALNFAGVIYFEHVMDDHAAIQRLARAVQSAPGNLDVLSNYAEMLLASGRDGQAKWAAARAREHADAAAYQKAAMSFVVFAAELLSGDDNKAVAELDEIARQVNAGAANERDPGEWSYAGIRRSLERRLGANPTVKDSAVLQVLSFVETNGSTGTLDQVRRLLGSELAKQ